MTRRFEQRPCCYFQRKASVRNVESCCIIKVLSRTFCCFLMLLSTTNTGHILKFSLKSSLPLRENSFGFFFSFSIYYIVVRATASAIPKYFIFTNCKKLYSRVFNLYFILHTYFGSLQRRCDRWTHLILHPKSDFAFEHAGSK